MKKRIIVKISEGLGNQLFMYANAYSISKKHNLNLNIDPYSGFYKNNLRSYMLNNFNITSDIAPQKWIFSNNYLNFVKKIRIKFDSFKKNKSFFFEIRGKDKTTQYNQFNLNNLDKTFYIDGNFESEKYFIDYRKDLLKEFSLKNNFYNNKYLEIINNHNVVSICIRQHRFSERKNNKHNTKSINKSNEFVKNTVDYIYRSIQFIKTKIDQPKFLLWSNDFKGLDQYFSPKEFQYIENTEKKILNDFFLLTQCTNFIVGPSTFNWWGAWLSDKKNKICIRPKNINPSNNKNFWPENWIKI